MPEGASVHVENDSVPRRGPVGRSGRSTLERRGLKLVATNKVIGTDSESCTNNEGADNVLSMIASLLEWATNKEHHPWVNNCHNRSVSVSHR